MTPVKSLEEYIAEQTQKAEEIKKELDILKNIDLKLFVAQNANGCKEFETRDYSLADSVELKPVSDCGNDYQMINFVYGFATAQGSLVIYCRHEEWHSDDKRFAQCSTPDIIYTDTFRHPIPVLLEFYEKQGVKPELLASLKEKLEDLHSKPVPEAVHLESAAP